MGILPETKRIIVQRLTIITLIAVVALGFAMSAPGQTPTTSPTTPVVSGVIGEVKAIDATANQIVVRADNSVIHTVNLSAKTQYKRMPIGEKSLTKATDIALTDVGPGDRVWARWRPGEDQKTEPTPQLVVMSKADITKLQEQDRAQCRWHCRWGHPFDGGDYGGERRCDGRPQSRDHSRHRQGLDAALSAGHD